MKPRDIYGIFALRGKVLNVRNASKSITGNNSEIQNLCKILNLKLNMDYTIDENFNTIHYQKGVMFLCDSDEDGAHISSLLLNFFFLHVSFFVTSNRKLLSSNHVHTCGEN